MKNVKFYNYYQGKTDIISVEMLVDDIEGENMDKLADNRMINKIEKLLQEARTHVAVEVNNTLLRTYMEIGKLLVEDINLHENEENYQNKTISMLSKELTRKFGKGFSRANIWNMITFYKEYGSVQTLSERLSWSHYCELLSISDKDKRHFYEVECANSRWSVRELRRQIASSLFERLLLSDGETNKQKVLELALKGNEIVRPQDIVKDPLPKDNIIIANGNDNGNEIGDDDSEMMKVLGLLEENASITAKQMSEQMDISTRKVSRLIKALKESGKIIRVGSDRKGYWKITQ